MSVINQMLRDLDKRQASPQALSRPAVPVATSAAPAIWALLLLPALWFGYQWFDQQRPTAQPVSQDKAATTPVTDSPSAAVVASTTPVTTTPVTTEPIATVPVATAPAISIPATAVEPPPEAAPPQAEIAEEPVMTADVMMAEPDADSSDAYALSAETTAFLHEAEAETPMPPAEKPQMTVTKTDPKQTGPQHLQALALQAQAAGRYGEAETAWLQLIRLQPQQPESYEALAQLYLQQQQPQRLKQLLQQAKQQQVQSVALQWAQVQLLAGTQQWQALLDALTPVLAEQFPQQALALEAHAAQQLGQTERALQAYQRWTMQAPQDSRAWLGLALLLDQSGQWPQAQQAYQQALQLGGLTDASRQFIQQRLQHDTQS